MRSPIVAAAALLATALALSFLPSRARGRSEHGAAQTAGGHRVRVGLVFDVGGRGDKSFNDGAYIGLEEAGRRFGVETNYLEPVGSEDRESALRLFAAQGFDLVLGIGFIFSSDVDAVARDYPKTHFACVDYASDPAKVPKNVAGLVFRDEEGAFLVGAVAGLLSKSKHVGFVGGMQTPLIRKFEAGYEAGVKRSCADCVVHGAYAGTSPEAFKDPSKGKALAIAQIAAGADVLFHASGSTGHGVFEGAHDAHVMAIGVDRDQYDEMPDAVVTSMIKRVDVAVVDVVQSVVEGRFAGGMRPLGIKEGALDYVNSGPHAGAITPAVRGRVAELKAAIVAGALRVPSL